MSAQFDFSEYLDSASRAFDVARVSYRLVLIFCASLVVFAIQGNPYKGSREYLSDLTKEKARIDEISGRIKGLEAFEEATKEGAVGELINEAESDKRKLMADLYAEIMGTPDEVDRITERLKDDKLTENEFNDAVAAELAKQYQFGVAAGLKVPLLDVVIERERIPTLFSILVAGFVWLLTISVTNLKRALQLFLNEAAEAGSAKKACDLLSMRGLSIFLPHGGVGTGLQLASLWVLHLLPAALVGYVVAVAWPDSSNQAKCVYSVGLLATLAGGVLCARSWVWIRSLVSRTASQGALDGDVL
jgi:hypothetical protein